MGEDSFRRRDSNGEEKVRKIMMWREGKKNTAKKTVNVMLKEEGEGDEQCCRRKKKKEK